MKSVVVTVILFISSIPAYATEFKLIDLTRYGAAPGMELGLRPENGNTLNEIFSVIQLPREEFNIRLIGKSSDKTNSELLKFYRDNMPKELDAALRSSRNLHNPALSPLVSSFPEALKSTTLYSSLVNELSKHGYRINDISFEKFYIKRNGSIPVPDVYLRCGRVLSK